jgi:hypothetical protein
MRSSGSVHCFHHSGDLVVLQLASRFHRPDPFALDGDPPLQCVDPLRGLTSARPFLVESILQLVEKEELLADPLSRDPNGARLRGRQPDLPILFAQGNPPAPVGDPSDRLLQQP